MIKLVKVLKRFGHGTSEEVVALDHVSIEVGRGEFLTVVGSNGSGKTTLLNIIAGSVKPDDGRVVVDGQYVEDKPEYARSAKIARIFQDANLGVIPGMTVEENLDIAQVKGRFPSLIRLLSSRQRRENTRKILASFNMKLEERLGAQARTLSGGQRQALAISMAVLSQAQILLLDEHTASLDPKTAPVIMRRTNDIIRDRQLTGIMVTHELHLALAYGTRLAMMHRGRIVNRYSPQEKKILTVNKLLQDFVVSAGDEWDAGLAFSSQAGAN